jgi:hypothetical protein
MASRIVHSSAADATDAIFGRGEISERDQQLRAKYAEK